MSKLSAANLKKTWYYLRRNGLKHTLSAAAERLGEKKTYRMQEPDEAQLAEQRRHSREGDFDLSFSIVVPTFRTPEPFLRRMIASVLAQTYPKFELILADATEDDSVRKVAESFGDTRIIWKKLPENAGISENTNRGLEMAGGDYVGLLDHDDVLTPDALYEMAVRIEEAGRKGTTLQLLYSDEDKCNADETEFFDPHFKEDFNPDLLMSNNYICHFLVMKRELICKLGFRKAYDGAQDFDLVLRAMAALWKQEETIVHVPKVLYHWRCHEASTAQNPQSKRYAYEAGLRAVQDFADGMGWKAHAVETVHLGFYRYQYQTSPLEIRDDLAAVGGPLVSRGRIKGGRMDEQGNVYYDNLPLSYSGYLHRASLQQNACVLDIRNLELRESLYPVFYEVTGVPYRKDPATGCTDVSAFPAGTDFIDVSIRLCAVLRGMGYRLLYLPERTGKL